MLLTDKKNIIKCKKVTDSLFISYSFYQIMYLLCGVLYEGEISLGTVFKENLIWYMTITKQ